MTDASAITDLLNAANAGAAGAQDAAFTLVYEELKRCAKRQGALLPGSSLTPTALVSELYLRLTQRALGRIENRRHFFALAARAMRQIAIDHARLRMHLKRGGDLVQTGNADLATMTAEQTLELDIALTQLARRDVDLAQLVEWHFFVGLSFADIGLELGCHERTVRRDWKLARAYLKKCMAQVGPL